MFLERFRTIRGRFGGFKDGCSKNPHFFQKMSGRCCQLENVAHVQNQCGGAFVQDFLTPFCEWNLAFKGIPPGGENSE